MTRDLAYFKLLVRTPIVLIEAKPPREIHITDENNSGKELRQLQLINQLDHTETLDESETEETV